jgi:multidrug efflux pump subunit AcrA (membrane-fusion protein)
MTPFEEPKAPVPAAKSNARLLVITLLVVAVAAVLVYFIAVRMSARTPQAVRVRVLSPRPTAVYRWFTGRGVVVEEESKTVAFTSPGKVSELWPPGTEFAAGEIVGRLQGAGAIETLLAHHRSRLAFYRQMLESMRAAGNQPEARQAELKLADKRRLIDETSAGLARLILRPSEPGQVVEVLAKVGATVKAGAPILKVKGRLLHGEFELSQSNESEKTELTQVTQSGLCRVEVIGLGPHASNADPRRGGDSVSDSGSPDAQNVPRFVDCAAPTRAGEKVKVTLPADLGLVPGQPLRLARHRYDTVFPVPTTAVGGDGARRSLWIATRSGVAERREVTVAEVSDDALVSDGLRPGEEVIVDPPTGMAEGAAISPER